MKNFKKMMALVVACVMVIGMMSTMAWAADPTGSITVKPSTTVSLANKTLKAYKILDATYSTETPQAVAYTIPAKLVSFYDDYFKSGTKTASDLAAEAGKTLDEYVNDIMGTWTNNSAQIKDFEYKALAAAKASGSGITPVTGTADGNNVKFSALEAGYYIVEDAGTATPISALMLDTVTNANVEIILKAEDKTVKEIMTADELVNSKANELGLGRAVNYKITQAIPETTGYDYYYYIINDTLSTGLTFNPETVKVTVNGAEMTAGTDYHLYYLGDTHNTTAAILGGKTFIVAFDNVVAGITANKYKTDDPVVITYSATVNSNAVVGVDPNTNKVNVQFSNNPDKDGQGDYDDDHPGIPANDGNHPTGNGPDKWTDSYTTKVTVLKKDGSNNDAPLPGVEFTLTGTAKDAVFNAEEVYEIDPAGEYWLLNNGKYTTTAPSTAPTVQETTGGAGWVEIVSGDNYAGADIRVVGTKKYRPYVPATDASKTRYIIIEANAADYASTTTKYSKVVKTSNAAEEYSVSRSGVTAASTGSLDFSQLGAGTYKLSETGVLAGFNGIPDINFTLSCTLPAADTVTKGTETASWEITNVTPSNVSFVKQNDGTFTITIQNNKGIKLPSTGGVGTTIFYIIGGILILGAAIALIGKKKFAR